MDLLFKRYASPFLIIDEMIAQNQLREFIEHLYEQEFEDLQWQYWLHKVHDKSFSDYKNQVRQPKQTLTMTTKQKEAQINKSKGILKNFQPK